MRLRRSKSQPPAGDIAAAAPATPAPETQPAAPPAGQGTPPPGPPQAHPTPAPQAPPVTGAQPTVTGQQPAAAGAPAAPAAPGGLDGLRAWVADLDRKLGIRTYLGMAALVLAIAASVLAIVLAVDARDNSASDDDLIRIEDQLSSVSEQAGAGATAQEDVDSLDARLSSLEDQVSEMATTDGATEKRIAVIEDDIDDLRQEISDLRGGAGTGAGGSTP